MIVIGILLVAFSVRSFLVHSTSLGTSVTGAIGAVLLAVGVLLLITELMVSWIGRGQTALVDGLQAG